MFVPCSTHRNLFAPVFLVSHYKKHCPLFLDGCGWKTHHSEGGKTSNASAWTRAEVDLCLDRQIRARSNHLELWEPVYLLSGKISLSEVPQWLKNVLIIFENHWFPKIAGSLTIYCEIPLFNIASSPHPSLPGEFILKKTFPLPRRVV